MSDGRHIDKRGFLSFLFTKRTQVFCWFGFWIRFELHSKYSTTLIPLHVPSNKANFPSQSFPLMILLIALFHSCLPKQKKLSTSYKLLTLLKYLMKDIRCFSALSNLILISFKSIPLKVELCFWFKNLHRGYLMLRLLI